MRILNPILCKIIIIALTIVVVSLYLYESNINAIFSKPATAELISEFPSRLSYSHYQKTIIIENSSYGYKKKYIQSSNGVYPDAKNETNESLMEPLYKNITIHNIKFGLYKIIVNTSSSIKTPVSNRTLFVNGSETYLIYLGNGTVVST